MNHVKFIFILALLVIGKFSRCQAISGVVNHYTKVTAITELNCKSTLTVNNVSHFNVGEKALIIQTQGGTFDQSNTANYGKITSYDDVGNYEFVLIDAINGNDITLSSVLLKTYTTSASVQLITVPSYTNVTVSNTLTANQWNGNTGGILVLEATGTVTLNANIDVSGKGFRAGQSLPDGGYSCGELDYFYSSTSNGGAEKGEGIYVYPASEAHGRGAAGNAGGGGNNHNAGGGGGSNYGIGGKGGNEWTNCQPTAGNGGIGGYKLLYTNTSNKIFLGGGGGAGHNNLNNVNTPGGEGGGIVIIKAASMEGNNFKILARGMNAPSPSINSQEGRGGGGAAGAILLNIGTYTSKVTAESVGGNGGNLNNTNAGPGGGGGGGAIWMSQPTNPNNLFVSVLGGLSGLDVNGLANGAVDGANGVVITKLQLIEPISRFSFGNDTTVCPGDTLTLDATTPNATYLWQDSSTAATYTVKQDGQYWVQITVNGCAFADTIMVNSLDNLYLGADTGVCEGLSITLKGGLPNASYLWSDGSTDSILTVNKTGTYSVTASLANCSATDEIEVTFYATPTPSLGPDTIICTETSPSYTLNAYYPNANYYWNTGETTAQITVDSTGNYWVTSWIEMCADTDSIWLDFIQAPTPNLGNDTVLCMGENLTFNVAQPYSQYLWNNGVTQPVFDISLAGKYWVEISNRCGTQADTVNVELTDCECDVFVPNSFTPNGNGDNDTFYPKFNCGFSSYKFAIYDRWGKMVFHTTDPYEQWDGTNLSGDTSAPGKYAYTIVYAVNPLFVKTLTGSVFLLK